MNNEQTLNAPTKLLLGFVALQVKTGLRAKRRSDLQLMDKCFNTALDTCEKKLRLSLEDSITTINKMIQLGTK
tara:strand:- start:12 stop:230 length:219 start_codon:yes stop_codon:yes gene_type:complete